MCRLHFLLQHLLVQEFCGFCCLWVCDFFFFLVTIEKRWSRADTSKILFYWSPAHCSPRRCNSFLNKWLKGRNRWPKQEDKQNINICVHSVHRNTDWFICLNTHLETWFSASQILWPHDTDDPPAIELLLLLFRNCDFATVTNRNVNICAFQWS